LHDISYNNPQYTIDIT